MNTRESWIIQAIQSTEFDQITLARIYYRMADLIESKGWVQHAPVGPNGERCTGQAMTETVSARDHRWFRHRQYILDPMLPVVFHVLHTWLGEPPAVWNDRPGRTAEEVVKTLRCLADFLAEDVGS